jgi:hypothetical protein
LLAVACAFCLLVANRGEALRVEVLGRSGHESDRGERSRLRFSDGSEVAIGAGAVLRIAALRARGADLQLARGSVRVHVANRPGTSFRLFAGEYRMAGNGASFDVDFDPDRQRLELDLASGSVMVGGPATRAEVNAGDHLSVQAGRGALSLEGRGRLTRSSPGDAEPEGEHQERAPERGRARACGLDRGGAQREQSSRLDLADPVAPGLHLETHGGRGGGRQRVFGSPHQLAAADAVDGDVIYAGSASGEGVRPAVSSQRGDPVEQGEALHDVDAPSGGLDHRG